MSRQLLHVHMPVYNTSPEFLTEAVDAVCLDMEESGVDDYSVKLLDDGSTDQRTIEAIDALSSRPKIDAMRIDRNVGVGVCRAVMLRQSIEEGAFAVASRDSDDITVAGSARTELDMLESGYGMVGGAMKIRELDGRERERHPHTNPQDLLTDIRRGLIPCFNPTVMHRVDAIPQGVTYRHLPFGEDIRFQAELLRAGVPLGNTDDTVAVYRRNQGSLTHGFGNGISSSRRMLREARALWAVSPLTMPEPADRAYVYLRSGAKLLPRKTHYFLSRVVYGNR